MKLYPPQLEGTLPAFYKTTEVGTTLRVPFSMNRAVSPAEVFGYSLRVKDVINGEEIFTLNTDNHSSTTEAIFTVDIIYAIKLTVGSYYKFQLAYIDKDGETGYYSTVGVVKCTAQPTVEIQGLNLQASNNHRYSYTGYYNSADDPTEKVYYYQFILTNKNGSIISDSGKQVHLVENNALNTYESIDTFIIPFDLEDNEEYLLQYIVTTNNNLVIKSPRYRILQVSFVEMTENIELKTKLNYDEGYVDISAVYGEDSEELYTLDTSSQFLRTMDYYEQIYNKVDLITTDYKPNFYYIYINNQYILDISESFNYAKTYYKKDYSLVKVTEDIFEANKYYIRKEHFVRGNFLISRSCKDTNYKEWYSIATIKIDGYGQIFYNTRDYSIEQGKYYKYAIQQYNNYGILSVREIADEIFADFEDMFLYDGTRQLKVRYNPQVSSFKINKIITKTDTIGGKYPYIFENSATYYHEFPVAGLISYYMDENESFMTTNELGLDEDYQKLIRKNTNELNNVKNQILTNLAEINSNNEQIAAKEQLLGNSASLNTSLRRLYQRNEELYENNNMLEKIYINRRKTTEFFDRGQYKTTNLQSVNIAAERIFKTEVLDWLNDGKPKLFRSPGEGNFIIILTNVSLSPENQLNRMLHSFTGTAYEIADFNYDNLSNLGIFSVDKLNYNFLSWKTINLSESKPIDNFNDNYFINEETYEPIQIYNATVQYNYEEILEENVAYCLYFSGMQPGTSVFIDGEEVVIGGTGSYYLESEQGISSVLIPTNSSYRGSLTYSYYGMMPTAFDTILTTSVESYAGAQFIGNNQNIVAQVNNNSNQIKNFGFLQFMMRDIIEVDLVPIEDWKNNYYTADNVEVIFLDDLENYPVDTEKNIYYYEIEDALDVRFGKVDMYQNLEPNKIYYKNNRSYLNPIYTEESSENKENYSCIYSEDFYLKNTTTKVDIKDNYYPLYKYYANCFIYNNEIIDISEYGEIIIYKDFYNNKYYIDEITKNEISEELLNELLNTYNFEMLNFNVSIDDNFFAVGPIYTHTKIGKKFNKYELVDIYDQEDFDNSNKTLYKLENGEYIQALAFEEDISYYIYQDYNEFVFYTTADCDFILTISINEQNCEDYYILDHVEVTPNYNVEHVRAMKGIFNFNSIVLGSGVVLNCSYQLNSKTYALEDFSSVNIQYYDGQLQYYKEQMEYYRDIYVNGSGINFELNDLDSIIQYYKDQILEEIQLINEFGEDSGLSNIHNIIEDYSKFLNVYNSYLSGEITDLTSFREALGDNGELLRTIESLINENVLIEQNAKNEYLKYLNLYQQRLEQLLIVYSEEE